MSSNQQLISLSINSKLIFSEPLTKLSTFANLVKPKKKSSKIPSDVTPKFVLNKKMLDRNRDVLQKILNKKAIFEKLLNTHFSKTYPDFALTLNEIESNSKNIESNLDKNNNKDYQKLNEMISMINNNNMNNKSLQLQQLTLNNYKNLNNNKKGEILKSISMNSRFFVEKLGLKNIKPNFKNNFINNINKNNFNSVNNNQNIVRNKNDKLLVKNNVNNMNNKINRNIITPNQITNNQIELFKTMTGNSNISDKEVISYFDPCNPKVIFAAEKYYRKIYGTDCLTLNYYYPTKKNAGPKTHKFKFTMGIDYLFSAVTDDFISMDVIKLLNESGIEIRKDKKIKCIGALNLANNSNIKVF